MTNKTPLIKDESIIADRFRLITENGNIELHEREAFSIDGRRGWVFLATLKAEEARDLSRAMKHSWKVAANQSWGVLCDQKEKLSEQAAMLNKHIEALEIELDKAGEAMNDDD